MQRLYLEAADALGYRALYPWSLMMRAAHTAREIVCAGAEWVDREL